MKNLIKISCVILFITMYIIAHAQPTIEWQKCLGGTYTDVCNSFQQTSDGGYILVGYTDSDDGDISGIHSQFVYDYWIVKLDNSRNVQWQKCLGGTGMEIAYSLQETSDGGYIVAGYSESNNGDVSGNHGGSDLWIVKLDNTGTIEWQKSLGGASTELFGFIKQTADGGYILAGTTSSNNGDVSGNHGNYDYWVVKLDNVGNIEWQKCLGGGAQEDISSIQQTSDGGYIVTGTTSSNNGDVSANHGSADYWVVKLDNSGNIQWQKCLGGSDYDEAKAILQTTDGGYVVAGLSNSNNGDVSGNHGGDAWIVKLDNSGNIQWQKCLGGSDGEDAKFVIQTTDGGYVVAGVSRSADGDVSHNNGGADLWVVKTDNSGNIEWQKSAGGSANDYGVAIEPTTDGGYVAAGYSLSNDGDVSNNHGYEDFWLVKFSTVTNLNQNHKEYLSIYPNPAKETININNQFVSDYYIQLHNALGQLVFEKQATENTTAIDIQNYPAGVYTITISQGDNLIHNKIVKQ